MNCYENLDPEDSGAYAVVQIHSTLAPTPAPPPPPPTSAPPPPAATDAETDAGVAYENVLDVAALLDEAYEPVEAPLCYENVVGVATSQPPTLAPTPTPLPPPPPPPTTTTACCYENVERPASPPPALYENVDADSATPTPSDEEAGASYENVETVQVSPFLPSFT